MDSTSTSTWLALLGAIAAAVLAFVKSRQGGGSSTPDNQASAPGDGLDLIVPRSQTVTGAPLWDIPPALVRYASLFAANEQAYGLPPRLLARIAWQESRGRLEIIDGRLASPAGAVGMMQILPTAHPEHPREWYLVPANAVEYAAAYLARLYAMFGSWTLAVAAYNAGEGRVRSAGNQVPNIKETRDYVAAVSRDMGWNA